MKGFIERSKDFLVVLLALIVDNAIDLVYFPRFAFYRLQEKFTKGRSKIGIMLKRHHLLDKRLKQLDKLLDTMDAYRAKYGLPVLDRGELRKEKV